MYKSELKDIVEALQFEVDSPWCMRPAGTLEKVRELTIGVADSRAQSKLGCIDITLENPYEIAKIEVHVETPKAMEMNGDQLTVDISPDVIPTDDDLILSGYVDGFDAEIAAQYIKDVLTLSQPKIEALKLELDGSTK